MSALQFLLSCSGLIFQFAGAQPPAGGGGDGPPPDGGTGEAGGASCDADGHSAMYNESINMDASMIYVRSIVSTGCPNHYSYCTGKDGITGCGAIGAAGTATEATEQGTSLQIPAMPVLRDTYGIGVANSDVQCELGAIAVAVNGVSIYGGAVDGQCTSIDVNSISAEWSSFDCCGGHSQNSGDYHYHFPPSCLMAQIGDLPDGHSPHVGWAYDGFPIYGPKGPNGMDMLYCDNAAADQTYCLDQCGGVEAQLPGVDMFEYRYYIVGAASDLGTLPVDPKPTEFAAYQFSDGRRSFTLNCFRGYTYTELAAGAAGSASPAGTSSGYMPSPHPGVSEAFMQTDLCATGGFNTEASMTNGWCSTSPTSSCYGMPGDWMSTTMDSDYDGYGDDGYGDDGYGDDGYGDDGYGDDGYGDGYGDDDMYTTTMGSGDGPGSSMCVQIPAATAQAFNAAPCMM